jgi:hypothetical protein
MGGAVVLGLGLSRLPILRLFRIVSSAAATVLTAMRLVEAVRLRLGHHAERPPARARIEERSVVTEAPPDAPPPAGHAVRPSPADAWNSQPARPTHDATAPALRPPVGGMSGRRGSGLSDTRRIDAC